MGTGDASGGTEAPKLFGVSIYCDVHNHGCLILTPPHRLQKDGMIRCPACGGEHKYKMKDNFPEEKAKAMEGYLDLPEKDARHPYPPPDPKRPPDEYEPPDK